MSGFTAGALPAYNAGALPALNAGASPVYNAGALPAFTAGAWPAYPAGGYQPWRPRTPSMTLCRDFQRGQCRYGPACKFAHIDQGKNCLK